MKHLLSVKSVFALPMFPLITRRRWERNVYVPRRAIISGTVVSTEHSRIQRVCILSNSNYFSLLTTSDSKDESFLISKVSKPFKFSYDAEKASLTRPLGILLTLLLVPLLFLMVLSVFKLPLVPAMLVLTILSGVLVLVFVVLPLRKASLV